MVCEDEDENLKALLRGKLMTNVSGCSPERYEGLLAWAMGLTNQQRKTAENLVQDAFVQLMLGSTRLEEIEKP
jgi:DNA-directed RNA polymerase specialized sigma24 family protein